MIERRATGRVIANNAMSAACCMFAVAALLFLTGVEANQTVSSSDERLIPGKPIEREIAEGQTHSYRLKAKKNQFIHVTIYQRGINVAVTLVAPDGKKIVESDLIPNGSQPGWISFITDKKGDYVIELRVPGKEVPAGTYEIRIEEQRKPTEQDKKRIEAYKLSVEAAAYNKEEKDDSYRKAAEKYKDAIELFRATGRRMEEAATLGNLAEAFDSLKDYKLALESSVSALAIYKALNDKYGEGAALYRAGRMHSHLSEYKEAIEYFEKALALWKEVGYRSGERRLLHETGTAHSRSKQYVKAIEFFERSLAISRELKMRGAEQEALHQIGHAYELLKKIDMAIDRFEQTLAISKARQDQNAEIHLINDIVGVYGSMGQFKKGAEYLEQLYENYKNGDQIVRDIIIVHLITMNIAAGSPDKSVAHAEELLKSIEKGQVTADSEQEAVSRFLVGLIFEAAGRNEEAEKQFKQGQAIVEKIQNPKRQAQFYLIIAGLYVFIERFEKVEGYLELALQTDLELEELSEVANMLFVAGLSDYRKTRSERSFALIEKSAAISHNLKDRLNEGKAYSWLAPLYYMVGRYDKAQEAYILRAGQNENFSREERLCGVRRPFSFFRDFFLLQN